MEWNAESVLDALNDFERKSEIPEILDQYLERIAKNGEIVFPWNKLKPLLKKKLEFVLNEFYETCPVETSNPVPNFETFNFENLKKTILQAVDAFTSAPFTIQRLCELVTNPTKHYNRTDKYMRGIEKNVLVVSTIEPRVEGQMDGVNANNPIVNGMLNSDDQNGHESADSVSSSNLNTPSNHVLLENFANVFPSAACIPPSADICEDAEVDTNFMSESPAEQELAPVESIGDAPSDAKDEEMDTREDERFEELHDQIVEEQDPIADVSLETPSEQVEIAEDKTEMETVEDTPTEAVVDTPTEAIVDASTKAVVDTPTTEESVPQNDPVVEDKPAEDISPIDDNDKPQTSTEEEPAVASETTDYIGEVASVIDKLDDFINPSSEGVTEENVSVEESVTEESVTEEVSPQQPDVEEVSQDGDSVAEPSEVSMDSESSTSSTEPEPQPV